MMMSVRTICVVVALVAACALFGCSRAYEEPATGDLIFQDLECGDLCDAIEKVTLEQFAVPGPRLSHVGMIVVEDGVPYVIEAYPPKVAKRPLEEVLARLQNSPPRFVRRGAMKCMPSSNPSEIARVAGEFLGRPYDDAFTDDDAALYCSELIQKIVKRLHGGDGCFAQAAMHYGAAGSAERRVWDEYFRARGLKTPEGKPGVSPLGLWLQVR